ncbi:MAG TPA: MarR family winged helix-turn-helix transcriptional regulator [Pararhizobium sp.]|nr:MarR family winged helix-turn-helix transcriptional regulator [Pararhizobium sp.]
MNTTTKSAAEAAGREDEDAAAIDLGPLENYIGFYLRLAQNASFKAFKRHTGESDLRPGWFAILSLIGSNPGITPMVLSRASGRDKSTITPVLRDLIRFHLISRAPIASDRRSYALYLTPAGEEKLRKLAGHAARHDDELDALVGDRKAELLELLRRIATELD